MTVALHCLYIVFNIINIVLHSSGCFLLNDVYRRSRQTVQQLYLINLSINEIVKNACYLAANILGVMYYSNYSPGTRERIKVIYLHVVIVTSTGVYFSYFLAMLYLICDRLLHVVLHLRYPRLWTVGRTRRLLSASFIVNSLLSFTLVLAYYFSNTKSRNIIHRSFYVYIPAGCYATYFIFATIAYVIIFFKFAQSRRLASHRDREKPEESLVHIFADSRFFVSVMIISSYLVLMVIPSLIEAYYDISKTNISEALQLYFAISITLSDTADGVIYIFMNPSVRRHLAAKISSCLNQHFSNQSQSSVLDEQSSPGSALQVDGEEEQLSPGSELQVAEGDREGAVAALL